MRFVLLRKDNVFSRACFPTRLPEFLETGKPVIISRVGDVDQFLEHKTNALLLNPRKNISELVSAVSYLKAEASHARAIGIAGMEVAARRFGFMQYVESLRYFVKHLSKVDEGR